MQEYLTIREVASLLKVHWQTVLNYIKQGHLEAVRLGNGYRVSTAALERFTKERTAKARRQ